MEPAQLGDPITRGSEPGKHSEPVVSPETVPGPAIGPELSGHEYCALFPEVTGTTYEELKQDIDRNGQQTAVTNHERKILDGRAVYRACRELGTASRCEEWNQQGSILSSFSPATSTGAIYRKRNEL